MIKANKPEEKDTRKVAIYARKSKVTESGKSVENQITKCKGYADLKFDAQESDILVYQDEGLSGYYSDRPQYMQLLRDIKAGKIKAVICYKFDRISRKTLDLLNFVDQLKTKKIAFISCTDDVDTASPTGKIVMSLLASIAEFERDIIAERITDNLYELAKEGRWLGGTTPLGFYSKKEHLNIGGRKSAVNHLEPVEDEQAVVSAIYAKFSECRSVNGVVAWVNERSIKTRAGVQHTRVSIKYLLQNPVYAIADADTYQYFQAFAVPIYAEQSEFDDVHGLMVYNKSEQTKELQDDSTATEPRYVRRRQRKEVEEWIIAVGKHSGVIPGRAWVEVQQMLAETAELSSKPHEKTYSLFSGLIYCPLCGKSMHTHRESGRYTAGKPKFLYRCRSKRLGECGYRDLRGNEIDRFVLDAICSLSDQNSGNYLETLQSEAQKQARDSANENEVARVKRGIEKLQKEINAQTQNLRDASETAKAFILEDIDDMGQRLAELQRQSESLGKTKAEHMESDAWVKRLEKVLLSLAGLLEELSYYDLLALAHRLVGRVYVEHLADGDDAVHLFFKGEPNEPMGAAGDCLIPAHSEAGGGGAEVALGRILW